LDKEINFNEQKYFNNESLMKLRDSLFKTRVG